MALTKRAFTKLMPAGIAGLALKLIGLVFITPPITPRIAFAGDTDKIKTGNEPAVYGIDVSHHQQKINWEEVYAQGIRFVFIKATEGVEWVSTIKKGSKTEKGIAAKPVIYGFRNKSGIRLERAVKGNSKLAEDYDLWIGHHTPAPDFHPWKNFLIHQYGSTGNVQGVPGDKYGEVDLNAFYGAEEEFRRKLLIP